MSHPHAVHLSRPMAVVRRGLVLVLVVSLALWQAGPTAAVGSDIVGPVGSGAFGTIVIVLLNGNLVVTDPLYDQGDTPDVGAVYLYDGATRALISTLIGTTANDQIGSGGLIRLANGNYLVRSPKWDNGAAIDAGAVTWGSATAGVSGAVGPGNSLVGSAANDQVGSGGFVGLTNGNYVVLSPAWDKGATVNAGAATWGNGATGVAGTISAANSLVGSVADDLWNSKIQPLPNGNYLVLSPNKNIGASSDAGAVTWGNGATGVAGTISAANSLVGSAAYDNVGEKRAIILPNGNYVITTPVWNNGGATDAGAATWGNGATGVAGTISAANSLVGSAPNDLVGDSITVLTNGNYLVNSRYWDNGATHDVGAVTWGSGTAGVVGPVSAANSLVGSTALDRVGYATALANGNYVVTSSSWDNGVITDTGAVTWGSGTTGVVGPVTAANSLVGSTALDRVGYAIALTNGNYVVTSSSWDNGVITDTGAVTWGSGTAGVVGPVTAANSLIGTGTADRVGNVTALTSGNYVVSSPFWDNGTAVDAGAVTWGSGTAGVVGSVSAANSLVGSTSLDRMGTVTALTNGNYVVSSPFWDNGTAVDAGAITWGSGTAGVVGPVTAANSLVGSTTLDRVGTVIIDNTIFWGVTALANGNYVVQSSVWDNGALVDAGAVTWGSGTSGVAGTINGTNSLVGASSQDQVGGGTRYGVTALANGSYVVGSPLWDNGATIDAGALTWGSGTASLAGTISAANSLVGASSQDQVGGWYVRQFSDGSYVAHSILWDNGASVDAGAVTWGSAAAGATGIIDASNSVLGEAAKGGNTFFPMHDPVNQHLVVGRPADNRVTVTDMGIRGLSAGNNGPTAPGGATTLSAGVAAGTNVTYSWDFGDGTSGSGASATHAYAPGTYTATVTATNLSGSTTANTTVVVSAYRVALPLLLSDR